MVVIEFVFERTRGRAKGAKEQMAGPMHSRASATEGNPMKRFSMTSDRFHFWTPVVLIPILLGQLVVVSVVNPVSVVSR